MNDMRELSDEFKLSVRSIFEVFEGLSNLVTRLARDRSIRLREGGKEKKPTRAAIVSALILWIAEQPEQQQMAIMAQAMDRLNALLGQDDEGGSSMSMRMDPSEPDLGPVGNRIAVPHEPPKKTPKRRSG
jgi:hypothetical protein